MFTKEKICFQSLVEVQVNDKLNTTQSLAITILLFYCMFNVIKSVLWHQIL